MNQRAPLFLLLLSFFAFSCGTENEPTYTLSTSVSPDGRGTISPSDGEYTEGEQITLTGIPSDGWVLSRWEGDWSSSSNPTTIVMDRDKVVVGVFERRDYPLNITIEGEGTVTETIVSQPTTDYTYETVVELTPNPSVGWEFVEWGGDLSGSESPQQITIDGEKNVVAKFENSFYLAENGVTVICPETEVGDKGTVNGIEYESVDRELLIQRRDQGSDLSKLCVSNVTNMYEMFSGSTGDPNTFNQPIGNWDVSNVTDMLGMFADSQFNQPIGDWDVSNVTDMLGMFADSQFNQPIGDWDVSNVTDMSGMFSKSQFNQPIGDWDVSNVTDMSRMFQYSPFNQPIGNWDVSNVTDMSQLFSGTNDNPDTFNQPIGDWNVSNVTDMGGMFSESQFNQPIENWDVGNVTDMYGMFYQSPFNQPIETWDVGSVTDMNWMFYQSPFNQYIGGWCVSQFSSEPTNFSTNSPLTEENKPIWGTCPD